MLGNEEKHLMSEKSAFSQGHITFSSGWLLVGVDERKFFHEQCLHHQSFH
jgi:hypothetical protein